VTEQKYPQQTTAERIDEMWPVTDEEAPLTRLPYPVINALDGRRVTLGGVFMVSGPAIDLDGNQVRGETRGTLRRVYRAREVRIPVFGVQGGPRMKMTNYRTQVVVPAITWYSIGDAAPAEHRSILPVQHARLFGLFPYLRAVIPT
jgi:hypothetical protein